MVPMTNVAGYIVPLVQASSVVPLCLQVPEAALCYWLALEVLQTAAGADTLVLSRTAVACPSCFAILDPAGAAATATTLALIGDLLDTLGDSYSLDSGFGWDGESCLPLRHSL